MSIFVAKMLGNKLNFLPCKKFHLPLLLKHKLLNKVQIQCQTNISVALPSQNFLGPARKFHTDIKLKIIFHRLRL